MLAVLSKKVDIPVRNRLDETTRSGLAGLAFSNGVPGLGTATCPSLDRFFRKSGSPPSSLMATTSRSSEVDQSRLSWLANLKPYLTYNRPSLHSHTHSGALDHVQSQAQ